KRESGEARALAQLPKQGIERLRAQAEHFHRMPAAHAVDDAVRPARQGNVTPLAGLALPYDHVVRPHVAPGESAYLTGPHARADREHHRASRRLSHRPASVLRVAGFLQ